MVVTLALLSKDLNDEALQELTIELRRTLIDETDIEAELVKGLSEKGIQGEPITSDSVKGSSKKRSRGEPTLGLIVLTFLTSGAAVALFEVFKSFFDRRKYLEWQCNEFSVN